MTGRRLPPVIEVRTSTPEATRALAAGMAAVVMAGDIILLTGELGAGKTVWVQGFARGLGVREQVTSPTFTLVRPYQGERLQLLHVDVYRLDRLSEVVDLGLVEQLDEGAVACIEWGELAEPALPADFLEVRIGCGHAATTTDRAADPTEGTDAVDWTADADRIADDTDDDERVLAFRPVGRSWMGRVDALNQALAPWHRPE